MELIDRSAVKAEIEKLEDEAKIYPSSFDCGRLSVCKELMNFLDTLEVKEVDLENSVKGRIDYPLISVDFPNIYPNYKELKDYCDKNGIKDEDEVKIIIIKDDML